MRGRGLATWCDGVRVWRGGCGAFSQLLLLLLVAASCGDGASAPDARPDAYSGPFPAAVPAACRFTVPDGLGLTEGADYECGDLLVYEDRDVAAGRTIAFHYIRVFSSASSSNATVLLCGGPGASCMGFFSWIMDQPGPDFLNGLLVDGDFLVIAKRGTALSRPALTSNESSTLSHRADLSCYNTGYSADDVDDLRSTLGYDQLNLWGGSYGTRLALEVMRRHGDHVRSSALSAVVPPGFNWHAHEPKSFYEVITVLDAACAAAGACGSAYGDLVAKLLAGVDSLNEQPLTFATGVTLDGAGYAGLLFWVMFDNGAYRKLPLVISDVAERRTDRVGETIAAWVHAPDDEGEPLAWGMFFSVLCAEFYKPPDESEFDRVNASVPASLRAAFAGDWEGLFSSCGTWPVPARPELSEPVTSAVRTLVGSGAGDPMTPAHNGDVVANTLSNREVVVIPASGHDALAQTPCGRQMLLAFLADPDQPLDTRCTESLEGDFELPSTRKAWTAADQARLVSALRYAPVLPPIRERLADRH